MPAHLDEARTLLDGLNPTMSSAVLSVGAKEYDHRARRTACSP